MASISFKNVVKIYDGATSPVVPNLNLEINDKEFIILVGPSGCGKSTTLRMLAGLESISSGEIYIGDRLVNKVPSKDRDISMVFQNYALYPHMNVYKNIAFGLTLRKEDKAEIDKRVHSVAKILDLEHLLERKPKELSGGQRQRVALGRCMVRQPAVFLLDEPLSNLDAKLRATMRTEIAKLHQRLNTTFVYVTHDQTEAMTMADRIVVMKDGIIQQYDTPQMLYDYPDNLFVAGFIGSPQMNFIDTVIEKQGEKLYAVVGKDKLLIPAAKAEKLASYVGKSVIMGLRPEAFLTEKNRTPDNTLNGELSFSELLGADFNLYLTVNEIKIIVRIPADGKRPAPGMVKVAADMEKAHFFDRDSELVITH